MKFIPKKRLERAADNLLMEFSQARSSSIDIPVPVEDILEGHFGLSLSFENLSALLGRDDVLGATFVDKREVSIDQTLDPEENPGTEGRFRFTVAHEIGHWLLHAPTLRNEGVSHALREKKPKRTDKDPREWQADYFAACLLMPKALLLTQWDEVRAVKKRPIGFDASNEMARRFQVSEQAMRIRLHDVGLAVSQG